MIKSGTVQLNGNDSVYKLSLGSQSGFSGTLQLNGTITANYYVLGPGIGTLSGSPILKVSTVNSAITWSLGTLKPFDTSNTLYVNGNYTQTGGVLELNGQSDSTIQKMIVAGNAQLGGRLKLNIPDGVVQPGYMTFPILGVSGTSSGAFSSYTIPTASTLYRWNYSTITRNGMLVQEFNPANWVKVLLTSPVNGMAAIGGEILVNDTTTNWQGYPKVAALSNGGFATVFTHSPGAGSYENILVKIYDSLKNVVVPESNVADFSGTFAMPDIAALKDGGFVVTWLSSESGLWRIRARVINGDGTGRAGSVLVNTNLNGDIASYPKVEASNDGGFVVVWNYPSSGTKDIFGKKFDKYGNAVSSVEKKISPVDANTYSGPAITKFGTSQYLVTWHGGSTVHVWGQFVDENLNKVGSPFQISTTTTVLGNSEAVDLGNNTALVVWQKNASNIYGQLVQLVNGVAGKVAGASETQLNPTSGTYEFGRVRRLKDGNVVVLYNRIDASNYKVFGRIFNTSLVAQASELEINPIAGAVSRKISADVNRFGAMMTAYYDDSATPRDGQGYGVYSRWYQTGYAWDSDGDGIEDYSDYIPDDNTIWQKPNAVTAAPITSGLTLWMDAQKPFGDNTTITLGNPTQYWLDFSTNATLFRQKVTARRPLYQANAINGLSAVNFDGSNDGLPTSTNITLSSGYGIALVYNGNNLTFGSGEEYALFSVGKAYPASGIRIGINRLQQLTVSVNTNTNPDFDYGIKKSGMGTGVHIIYVGLSGTVLSVYDNAVFVASINVGALNQDQGSTPLIGIDQTDGVFGHSFKGAMGDILLYNRALSTSEMQNISYFLSSRWAMTTSIDSDSDGLVDAYDGQPTDGTILEYQVAAVSPFTWIPSNGKTAYIKSGTVKLNGNASVLNLKLGSQSGFTGILEVNGTISANIVSQGPGTGSITGSVVLKVSTINSNFTFSKGTIKPLDNKTKIVVVGNYVQTGGVLELRDYSESSYDVMTISGTAQFGGQLKFSIPDNVLSEKYIKFQLFSASSYSGGFSSYVLPTSKFSFRWNTASVTANGALIHDYDPSYWQVSSRIISYGDEIPINDTKTNDQYDPKMVTLANGNIAVVYTDQGLSIKVKVIDKNGTVIVPETKVNNTGGSQRYPDIAALNDGGFGVAWQTLSSGKWWLYARAFNADGTARSANDTYVIKNSTYGCHAYPSRVASAANGGFVVVWVQLSAGYPQVKATRFNSSGGIVNGEVGISTTFDQRYPGIVKFGSNKFLITWSGYLTTSWTPQVGSCGKFVNDDLTGGGSGFKVNTNVMGVNLTPIDLGNTYAVLAWNDGSNNIVGQKVDSSGVNQGSTFTIVSGGNSDPSQAKVLSNGNIIFVYNRTNTNTVKGMLYDSNMSSISTEFDLNPGAGIVSKKAVVTVISPNVIVASYYDQSATPRDGSGCGVFARRYTFGAARDYDRDGYIDLVDEFMDDPSLWYWPAAVDSTPVTNTLSLWLDSQHPVGNNGAVALNTLSRYMLDLSANKNKLDQVTANFRALYKQNALSGINAMVFDGTNDVYVGNKAVTYSNGGYSIGFVYNADSLTFDSGENVVFALGKSMPASGIKVSINPSRELVININNDSDSDFDNTFTVASMGTGTHVVYLDFSGSTLRVFDNGILKSSFTTAALNIAQGFVPIIGAENVSGTLSHPYKGMIGDLLFYNSTLTETERMSVINYLAMRWGMGAVIDTDGDGLADLYDGYPIDGTILEYRVENASPFNWVPITPDKQVYIGSGTVRLNGNATIPYLLLGSRAGYNYSFEIKGTATVNVAAYGSGTGGITGNATVKLARSDTDFYWSKGTLKTPDNQSLVNIYGNFFQTGGTLELDVVSPNSLDSFSIAGTAQLAGTLKLNMAGVTINTSKLTFPLFTAFGYSGGYNRYVFNNRPDPYPTYIWKTSTITANGTLTYTYDPRYWVETTGLGPESSEFIVNDLTARDQWSPRTVTLSNGHILVVFAHDPSDVANDDDIHAKIIDSRGRTIKPQFLIATVTNSNQAYPNVIALKSGKFAVVWTTAESGVWTIKSRLFTNDGVPIAEKSAGNANTPEYAAITETFNGGYGIAWLQDNGVGANNICVRSYNPDGTDASTTQIANNYTYSSLSPSIKKFGADKYIIVWTGYGSSNAPPSHIYGRFLNSSFSPIGTQFIVNDSSLTKIKWYPDVIDLENGKFLVTYCLDSANGGIEGYYKDLYGQMMNSDGTRSGSHFQISSGTTRYITFPRLRKLDNPKRILAVYSNYVYSPMSYSIYGRLINFDGSFASNQTLLSQSTMASVGDVTPLPGGGAFVTYYDNGGLDGSGRGVVGRFCHTEYEWDTDHDGVSDMMDYFPDNADLSYNPAIPIYPSVGSGLNLFLDAQNPVGVSSMAPIDTTSRYWLDTSGRSLNFDQSKTSARAKYKSNAINGKPAMYFDGVNDSYPSSKNVSINNGGYSIAMIYNGNDLTFGSGQEYALFSVGQKTPASGIRVGINANQQLTVSINTNTDTEYDVGLKKDAMGSGSHLIYINYNGTTVSLYVDNVLAGSVAASNLNMDQAYGMFVGMDRINGTQTNYFKGAIGDILVYNRSLSDSEKSLVTYFLSTRWGLDNVIDSDGDGLIDIYDGQPTDGTILEYQVETASPFTWIPVNGKNVYIKSGTVRLVGDAIVPTLNLGSVAGFSGTLDVNGTITANILKQGPGTAVLSSTTVLKVATVNRSITWTSGTLKPQGTKKKLFINGNYTQTGGALSLRVNGTSSIQNERVSFNGTVAFGGQLTLDFAPGVITDNERAYKVMSWTGSKSGSFSPLSFTPAAYTYKWDTLSVTQNGELKQIKDPNYWKINLAPDGSDFMIYSESVTNHQSESAMSVLSNGNCVVVYTSIAVAGTPVIRGKIFGTDKSLVKSEFAISATTSGTRAWPAVMSMPSGGFIVVWLDGSTAKGRAYTDNTGNTSGTEFTIGNVNTFWGLDVVRSYAGGFVVCWSDYTNGQVKVKRYSFASAPAQQVAETVITTNTTIRPGFVSICTANINQYCVVSLQTQGTYRIKGQIIGDLGAVNSFMIDTLNNTYPVSTPEALNVGKNRILVAYPRTNFGIVGQFITYGGARVGGEFTISQTAITDANVPSLTRLRDGNILVMYQCPSGSPMNYAIKGRVMTPSGNFITNEIVIMNTSKRGNPPVGAALTSTRLLVAGNDVATQLSAGVEGVIGNWYTYDFYRDYDADGVLDVSDEFYDDPSMTTMPSNSSVLPVTSGLQLWLDAQKPHGDSPVFNGTGLRYWLDFSGSKRHGYQSGGVNMPTYRDSGTAQSKGVDFGLYSEPLFYGLGTVPSLTDLSCVVVVKPNDRAGGVTTVLSGNGNRIIQDNNVLKINSVDSGRLLENQAGDKVTPNETFMVTVVAKRNGPQTFYVNGISRGSVLARDFATSAEAWILGASNSIGSNPYNGIVKEVIVYNRVLTDIEKLQLENYLRTKWGILENTWVDMGTTKDVESGSSLYPYNTMKEGIQSVKPGGIVYISNPGSDMQPMTITKNVKIRALNGPGRIGH